MTLHAHISTASRDCDGAYHGGHDTTARPDEGSYDFAKRMFGWLFTMPDPYGGPVNVNIDTDDQGRIVMVMGRKTEEGFENETVYICEKDDYDPDYDGTRDLTAERAGY